MMNSQSTNTHCMHTSWHTYTLVQHARQHAHRHADKWTAVYLQFHASEGVRSLSLQVKHLHALASNSPDELSLPLCNRSCRCMYSVSTAVAYQLRQNYYGLNNLFADFTDAKSLAEMLMRYVCLILIYAPCFPLSTRHKSQFSLASQELSVKIKYIAHRIRCPSCLLTATYQLKWDWISISAIQWQKKKNHEN